MSSKGCHTLESYLHKLHLFHASEDPPALPLLVLRLEHGQHFQQLTITGKDIESSQVIKRKANIETKIEEKEQKLKGLNEGKLLREFIFRKTAVI